MTKDVGGLNWKGLFSRHREPKAAVDAIRQRHEAIEALWTNDSSSSSSRSSSSSSSSREGGADSAFVSS